MPGSAALGPGPSLLFEVAGEQLVVLGDLRHGPGAGGKRGEHSRAVQGPVHGGPADAEQGGDLGDVVIAAVVHAADLAVLGGLKPWLLAAQLAVLAGYGHALAGALADQVGLELGDDGEDLQEHPGERVVP